MRVKYIDVLKMIAIIAVVLYHAGFVKYGYLGVDVFLVISGYLTTKSLNKSLLKCSNWGGYLSFEKGRLLRLMPLLLLAGIFCMLCGYYVMLPDDYLNLADSVLATNLFANNIFSASNNYWDVLNEYKPLMHTWYVGLLFQFYVIYPIFFLIAKRDDKNSRSTLITIISILAIISFVAYFSTSDSSARFYYLHTRFYEFAVGGIAALLYNPQKDKPFGKSFVYYCYILLFLILFFDNDIISPVVRLVVIVGLSCILICSYNVLENRVSGNVYFAKIGSASYSIFIWHQIILAFYRYSITNKITVSAYMLLLLLLIILSFFSYRYLEHAMPSMLKKTSKYAIITCFLVLFFFLNIFAGAIYLNAGVVRDVPELYFDKNNIHRRLHAEYVDRVYKYDVPFKTNKKHWYVIGNSFARDFVNVILESPVSNDIEISYSTDNDFMNREDRFKMADCVFLSTYGLNSELVNDVERFCLAGGLSCDQLYIVGEKNFGANNGQIYFKRNEKDYFDTFVEVIDNERYIDQNNKFANLYKSRFINLMSMVTDPENNVRVFTPDHHYISCDCRHLTVGGAKYFGQAIDWTKYLN